MSLFPYSYSYSEETPTVEGVDDDISNIVGLCEIKSQLKEILRKIVAAKRCAGLGLRVVPPMPFHMVFLGNHGTGKSAVARIVAKLFYLAGVLPSYDVIEIHGSSQSVEEIEEAKGGILVINIGAHGLQDEVSKGILSAMNEGETAVIFAGQRKEINETMSVNKELYGKISATLCFKDLTGEELAILLENEMNNQAVDEMRGLKLHQSCCVEAVGKLITQLTSEKLRESLNALLVYQMLLGAKCNLESRTHVQTGASDDEDDQSTITMKDLETGLNFAIIAVS